MSFLFRYALCFVIEINIINLEGNRNIWVKHLECIKQTSLQINSTLQSVISIFYFNM